MGVWKWRPSTWHPLTKAQIDAIEFVPQIAVVRVVGLNSLALARAQALEGIYIYQLCVGRCSEVQICKLLIMARRKGAVRREYRLNSRAEARQRAAFADRFVTHLAKLANNSTSATVLNIGARF